MNSRQLSSLRWQRAALSVLRLLPAMSIPVMLLLLLLWSLSASASQAASGTWYVSPQGSDGNSCSTSTAPCRRIQAALDRAGAGDTVNVAKGTYTDSTGTVAHIVRDVTLRGGWNVSFAVRDPVASPTVLDAQAGGPVIIIRGPGGVNTISPKIEGFVLTNGNGTGVAGCAAPGAGGCGGGIFGTNTTPYILDNVITDNVAATSDEGFGGGIYLQGQLVGGTIEGNTIVSNAAAISSTAFISGWGGGICLHDIATVVYDNLIQDNVASTTKGWGYGGGILLYRSVGGVISNVVVSNIASTVATGELSGWGGGISVVQSGSDEVSIIDNELRDNTASLAGHGWGGGIQIGNSTAVISGNRIIANIGGTSTDRGDGGGIYGRYGSWTIRGNDILSNTSATVGRGFGGGCQLENADVTLEYNLIAGNTAGKGVNSGLGGGVNVLRCDGGIVRYNTIRDNLASQAGEGYGGGLSVRYGPLTVEGNYIFNNRATGQGIVHSWGGGVRVDSAAPVTFTNNVIAHNQARTEGGGIHVYGNTVSDVAYVILIHNTLAENALAGTGEGVYVTQNATVSMTNNIVVSHSYGVFCETGSSSATAYYTLFYGNDVADTAGPSVTSSHPIAGAPHFVAPADENFHIRWASAALDSGTSTYVDNDIDHDLRPIGDEVDVGADELNPCEIYLPVMTRNDS